MKKMKISGYVLYFAWWILVLELTANLLAGNKIVYFVVTK